MIVLLETEPGSSEGGGGRNSLIAGDKRLCCALPLLHGYCSADVCGACLWWTVMFARQQTVAGPLRFRESLARCSSPTIIIPAPK